MPIGCFPFLDLMFTGAPYVDETDSNPMAMGDHVMPGQTVTQTWAVPPRAGPTAAQGSSIMWLYHSHLDETRDTV